MAFPTSIPSNTDPTALNTLAIVPHAELHQSHNAEIVAIETKLGTGSSSATVGKVLRATGTGTSAWAQVDPTVDIATLTSSTLRSLLTDETGTGASVFGTAPTISSPVITTPSITTSINDSNGNEAIKVPATASATNEITVTNAANGTAPVISATGSSDTNIDLVLTPKGTGMIKTSPVNKIDWTALPLGSVVQVVTTNFISVATGTTTLPADDTIPQITEGNEFMTQAITPKSSSNMLVIEADIMLANSANGQIQAALFQDAASNAIAASALYDGNFLNNPFMLRLSNSLTAGTTSSTTFRIRAGTEVAGTITFNGASGARRYGAITKSSIKITEYKA